MKKILKIFRTYLKLIISRIKIRTNRPLNVVIGSGNFSEKGWISTEIDILDITNEDDWKRLFSNRSIDSLLSEHVFEHLSIEDTRKAFSNCYKYLKHGGYIRIAVPDGYRPDMKYHKAIAPPIDGHLTLFNVDLLKDLLETEGFIVKPLEYFDTGGGFNAIPWDENKGKIIRSTKFDRRSEYQWDENVFYTSLIIDAHKE